MSKSKYYVVWKGKKPGVYTSWSACKRQIDGFEGAEYKSFPTLEEAEVAFSKSYLDYKGKKSPKKKLSNTELEKLGKPILESIAVDAACSGNPGKMEYRGVVTNSKKQLFRKGPFEKGTNNIGEFLALVHALAYLQKKNRQDIPIYSDSKIALSWVRQRKCKTKLTFDETNSDLKDLIDRAENWLKTNNFKNKILKWETKAWGEIPADFGRK